MRNIMMVLAAAVFAGAASMRVLDALLPGIAKYYGTSIGATGGAVTAYALSYSVCQLLYGPLGDRSGPYRIITLAAMLSGVAALGCAIAPTLNSLVALRLVAGGIAAAIGPLTMAWISHATTAQERPVAVANITGASILGATAGQVGGGLVGQFFDWQASFLFIGVFFGLSGLALLGAGRRRPDFRLIGRSERTSGSGSSWAAIFLLLRRPAVRFTLMAVGMEGFATYMSFTYISGLLHDRLALSMGMIGLSVALFGMGGILFVLLARRVVENWTEGSRAFFAGWALGAAFVTLMLARSALVAAGALFLLGFAFFLLHNILQVRATHMAPDQAGAALSLFAATFFLGQAIGARLGGWWFDHLDVSLLFGLSGLIMVGLGFVISRKAPPMGS